MSMLRWTMVVDYDGGTYIRQAVSPSIEDAERRMIADDSAGFLPCLAENAPDDYAPIDGVENTWCISGLHKDKLVIAHIVLTADR
jgi:hypothetical protein